MPNPIFPEADPAAQNTAATRIDELELPIFSDLGLQDLVSCGFLHLWVVAFFDLLLMDFLPVLERRFLSVFLSLLYSFFFHGRVLICACSRWACSDHKDQNDWTRRPRPT